MGKLRFPESAHVYQTVKLTCTQFANVFAFHTFLWLVLFAGKQQWVLFMYWHFIGFDAHVYESTLVIFLFSNKKFNVRSACVCVCVERAE